MDFPVIKASGYILVHTPNILKEGGSTQTTTRAKNPDDEYLKKLDDYLRTFAEVVSYAPNQAYIGNILPDELKNIETPWYEKENFIEGGRFGDFGEIMPEDEFYALLKHVDVFDLVKLNKEFIAEIEAKVSEHPILKEMKIELGEGEELSELEALLDNHAEPLYLGEKLVGCVKRAHESDVNLNAHTI